MATRTAVEMAAIKSREKIADKDREFKEKEFKHKKAMDIASGLGKAFVRLFSGGTGAAADKVLGKMRNDPSFYKKYIPDLDKFTNISTYIRLGSQFYQGNFSGYHDSDAGPQTAPIGIAVIHWEPAIGKAPDNANAIPNTPINQILMRTKEQVLKSNSRSNVPYEAADLGLNFIATASILTAIGEYERMILIAQTYKADNAYYADRYINVLGGTPSAWISGLAEARKNLLILKKRFNSALVAPKQLSLYEKWLYYATLWVKDSENSPAAVYTALASHYYKLNNAGDTLNAIQPNRTNPSVYYSQISSMIQSISENPDYQAMYADLRSAVTDLIILDETFNESAQLTENHDSMALEQIANIQTLPGFYESNDGEIIHGIAYGDSLDIKQTTSGYLYQGDLAKGRFGPVFSFEIDGVNYSKTNVATMVDRMYNKGHTINFHKDNISGDDVLDATRWHIRMASGPYVNDDEVNSTTYLGRVISCDTTIARFIQFWAVWKPANGNVSLTANTANSYMVAHLSETAGRIAILKEMLPASQLDWMPIIHYAEVDPVSYALDYSPMGEVQHLVPVGSENIDRLNEACVLSEFYLDTSSFKR